MLEKNVQLLKLACWAHIQQNPDHSLFYGDSYAGNMLETSKVYKKRLY